MLPISRLVCQASCRSLLRPRYPISFVRSISDPSKPTPKIDEEKYINPPSKWRSWLADKVLNYLENKLKKYPAVYKLYRMPSLFWVGSKELLGDLVEYMKISGDLTLGRSTKSLTFKELVIYYETPKSLWKVSPTLLMTGATMPIPGSGFIILPLANAFPKHLLSHHFWTLEQKVTFELELHTKRLQSFKPVFRHLQNRQSKIYDVNQRQDWNNILEKLGSGQHPSVEEVISLKSIFESGHPYSMESLGNSHLSDLCRLHALSSSIVPYGRRYRLMRHAAFLHEMDNALNREGGAESLSIHDLKKACFFRGLNAINTKDEDLVPWLNDWLKLSSICDGHTFSLLLHCPIFLSYNHPSNWRLIYG